jgi:hypothetical protein
MASRRFLVVVSAAKIYVTANPLRSDRRKRTKDSIAKVRHLYLDFDNDGEARLTSLPSSDAVPTPTAILSTSLGKYQILCRIDRFTFERQGAPSNCLRLPSAEIPPAWTATGSSARRDSGIARTIRHIPSPSSTLAIRLRIQVTFRWIFRRQMRCLCPMQSHCESTPASTPIPNTMGRGSCTNLPTEKTPRR